MKKTAIVVVLLWGFMAGVASAQIVSAITFEGHSYETGGFPPSDYHDELSAVGLVVEIEDPLYWRPDEFSYTWYLRGMLSEQELAFGSTRIVTYLGSPPGTTNFTIYKDYYPSNHDYGVNPPNATVPSTFSDHIIEMNGIYAEGYFINDAGAEFTLTYNTITESGSFTGTLNFTGGIIYPNLNPTDGWAFGSDTTAPINLPGYDLELNGDLSIQVVSVDATSWSNIKALYR